VEKDMPLARAFCIARSAGETSVALEVALAEAVESGRRAWPGIRVEQSTFVRHLADVVPREAEPAPWIMTLHAADLFLACGCAEGDAHAIAAFEQHHLSAVAAVLARAGTAGDLANEVQQTVRVRLLVATGAERPKIHEYGGRGSLAKWLRVVILRTATSLGRSDRARAKRHAEGPPPALAVVDAELAMIRGRYESDFNAALREAFGTLSPAHRNVLRLHFIDGLTLPEVGRAVNASRATAARMILAAREHLYDEVARLLHARLGVDARELESLLAVVRSGLEVSLRTALGAAPTGT
jgi:RNA polymerase sigma-70 factor (ECF subfamily)